MRITADTNPYVPPKVEFIGLHRDSPKEDWQQLIEDVKSPQCRTIEGNPVIAIDYETHAPNNCYKDLYLEHAMNRYREKLGEYEAGERRTKPSKPSPNSKEIPLDIHHSKVTGVVICANILRSYYVNFAHSDRDGIHPCVSESNQNKLLQWIFSHAPDNLEYVAHNAAFEYQISTVNGLTVWWDKADRFHGGFIDTMILAQQFNFEGVALKKLTNELFNWEQLEYMEAIRLNHLAPKLKEMLPEVFHEHLRWLIKQIKSNLKIESKSYARLAKPPDAKTIREINKVIVETDEAFSAMNASTLLEVLPYAAQDGYWTLNLFYTLHKAAQEKTNDKILPTKWEYYRKIEHPIIKCVADMGTEGTRVDIERVMDLREICRSKTIEFRSELKEAVIEDLRKAFPKLASGENFTSAQEFQQYLHTRSRAWDPDMPDYLYLDSWIPSIAKNWDTLVKHVNSLDPSNRTDQKTIFFRILGLPVYKETDKGNASLSKEVMPRYALVSKTASVLVTLKKVIQVNDLYAQPYPRFVHTKTGKVHSSTRQNGADTGRFTMNNPNLQQMSKRYSTQLDKDLAIRQVILANSDDSVLLAADFSQIELRLMAELSQDPNLMQCYTGDEQGKYTDVHTKTCEGVFRDRYTDMHGAVDDLLFKESRKSAKTLNFLTIYQGGPRALLGKFHENGIFYYTLEDAERFLNMFYELYQSVGTFNEHYGQYVAPGLGYGETEYGRRKYLPDLHSNQKGLFFRAVRQACNQAIQGTCADIIKIAIARLYWNPDFRDLGAKILVSVHDELLMDVPRNNLPYVVPIVEKAFTDFPFKVPIKTSVDVGRNFGDLSTAPSLESGDIDWSKFPKWVADTLRIPCPADYKKYAKAEREPWNVYH